MNFESGDMVRLKSGGPLMTVEQAGKKAVTEEEAVWCIWFENVGAKRVVQRETFPPQTLEKTEKPSGSINAKVVRS